MNEDDDPSHFELDFLNSSLFLSSLLLLPHCLARQTYPYAPRLSTTSDPGIGGQCELFVGGESWRVGGDGGKEDQEYIRLKRSKG
jgi:hypothetical protein